MNIIISGGNILPKLAAVLMIIDETGKSFTTMGIDSFPNNSLFVILLLAS